MGRRNLERTILSCLRRADKSCCKSLQAPYLPFRLCHTASKSGNISQNTEVYHDGKRANKKVKIGNKIYILETPKVQSSKENSAVLSKKSNLFDVTNLSHGKTHAISGLKDTERNKGIRSKVRNSKSASSADLDLSLAQFSREGLEFAAILRQPLIKTSKEKPFLVEIQTLTVDGNSGRKLPFYTPGVKDVLRATQSITDHVRSQLRNEVHLRKLGPQGFSNYVKDSRAHVKDFENLLFEYLESGDDTLSVVSPVIEAYWESLKPILKDIAEPICLKKTAIHPNLRYKADIDYVATYRSRPCLVKFQMASWKNSIDEKVFFENRLQLLACLGALNFDPSWSHQISSGVLIRAYSDGSPADVVVNSVKGSQYHWKTWLRMVEQFWRQYDKQCENKEVLSDIGQELKEESDCLGKESEHLLANDFTSTTQFNRKIENVTDFSSSCKNSSTERLALSNMDFQVHTSNFGDVSDAREKTSSHQTTNDVPQVDLKGISAFKADDQNESQNYANFANPIPVNSMQDYDNKVKHEQTSSPPDDLRESEKERPQTRVTVLLNSLKNLWKS